MAMAHLIVEDGPDDTTVVVPVNDSGRFSFMLNEPGGYGMYATGVNHETLEMPLILTTHEKVELHIQLGVNQLVPEMDTVQVVVAGSGTALDMQRRPDGKFAARVKAAADTLAYQIRGVMTSESGSEFLAAGASQDRLAFNEAGFFWRNDGDYYSVVDVRNMPFVDIVLDPLTLPQHVAGPTVKSVPPFIAEIVDIYVESKKRHRRITELGPSYSEYGKNAGAIGEVKAPFREKIGQEQDPLLRQWLLLRYSADLASFRDSTSLQLAREAFEMVPANSPFWSFEAWNPLRASALLIRLARRAKDDEVTNDYLQQVIGTHPDPDVRAEAAYAYKRLANWESQPYFATDRLRPGKRVPEFTFVSLDDSTDIFTDRDLLGRTYLIDLWGTWCKPCVAEIPALEQAYDRFKDSGFEILSVAFHNAPEEIRRFRKEQYAMPWLHTVVGEQDNESVAKAFELIGYPKPILVNERGTIVAMKGTLRGEKTMDALSALLDARK